MKHMGVCGCGFASGRDHVYRARRGGASIRLPSSDSPFDATIRRPTSLSRARKTGRRKNPSTAAHSGNLRCVPARVQHRAPARTAGPLPAGRSAFRPARRTCRTWLINTSAWRKPTTDSGPSSSTASCWRRLTNGITSLPANPSVIHVPGCSHSRALRRLDSATRGAQ